MTSTSLSNALALPMLGPRKTDSHKGNYGRVLLIGGSYGMCGAIGIAVQACLRSGAGLVTAAVPEPSMAIVANYHPCAMMMPLTATPSGKLHWRARSELLHCVEPFDAIAIGPGLGRSYVTTRMVRELFTIVEQPMVVDADALFALSSAGLDPNPSSSNAGADRNSSCIDETIDRLSDHRGPRILTPHAGELERLIGVPSNDRGLQIEGAHRLAKLASLHMILKGNHTLITDGDIPVFNPTGNPGMASGGSGDCLTGILAALLGQGMKAIDAARLGTYWHGLAGDLALQDQGGPSVLATDLIEQLPRALSIISSSPTATFDATP